MTIYDTTDQTNHLYRVIDLKQYVYCARVAYYQIVLPGVRPITYKMERGVVAQEEEEQREQRRSLRVYGLNAGERTFNAPLVSTALGLSGLLDMLIETEEELIPVDYKNSKKVGAHFKLQLMAYGRLLEEVYFAAKPVRRGFLYLIPQRKALPVTFDKRLRGSLETAIEQLHHIAQYSYYPAATNHQHKCVDCEFRRFCNDIM
jgi:CRISPR-associated exonuclease Cas4